MLVTRVSLKRTELHLSGKGISFFWPIHWIIAVFIETLCCKYSWLYLGIIVVGKSAVVKSFHSEHWLGSDADQCLQSDHWPCLTCQCFLPSGLFMQNVVSIMSRAACPRVGSNGRVGCWLYPQFPTPHPPATSQPHTPWTQMAQDRNLVGTAE